MTSKKAVGIDNNCHKNGEENKNLKDLIKKRKKNISRQGMNDVCYNVF